MARLTATQEKWAGKGQRVLLLARRVIRAKDLPEDIKFDGPDFGDYVNEELNQELTIVGLVGLVDPPRDDIPEVNFSVAWARTLTNVQTVRIMRNAGIRFFMVTGDFALSKSIKRTLQQS